jgi:hypothetical protein
LLHKALQFNFFNKKPLSVMNGKNQKRTYRRKSKPQSPQKEIKLSHIWYTPQEVAAIFKITARALRYWCQRGVIIFYKPQRFIQFNKAHVDDLLERSKRGGPTG